MQAGEQGKYVVPVGEEGKATGTHKDRPYRVLDLHHLTKSGRQLVVDRAMKTEDQDNEAFLQRYAERVKRCFALLQHLLLSHSNDVLMLTPEILNMPCNALMRHAGPS